MREILSSFPSVDTLLKQETMENLAQIYTRNAVKEVIQTLSSSLKKEVISGNLSVAPSITDLEIMINKHFEQHSPYSLKRVINATGTILHTNLGRSIMSKKVQAQLEAISFHYSNLEFDLATGGRGSRYTHLEEIIKELTGAEDVVIVNNNAAAVLLALSTLAKDKEILISRGELVEIGGAFRIPEVIKLSGGKMIELGTTNKTHLVDYEQALSEGTGAILKVHTSNYRIIGFTKETAMEELANLAHENNLPLINDLGSGLFIDMRQFGLPYEPTIKQALEAGSDIVTFSGDKLLGGPQAGIIVGKKEYIAKMKKNQLLRALRIDKMTLAALEATFELYKEPKEAIKEIPVLKMLALTKEECLQSSEKLLRLLENIHADLEVSIIEENSFVGGGSYPEFTLPTSVLALKSKQFSADELQEKLRQAKIPIISRVKNEANYLDVRTIDESEFKWIQESLQAIF
ncbi:MAG: L-seryl-tRNA(Sec) selenium transferase [Streptococcaceae bacterium]|jgi:L-seryl-tRNA(Ser) seleniumtransferase|nr:L-seryl-tRNA(Sec) selenium transferase [Streptococcaceae bacterium]